MKMMVCAVRDAKGEAFGRPLFYATVGLAIRDFTDEINRKDPQNQMNKYPEDFALYQLGTFDDQDGSFEGTLPKILVMGDQVIISEEVNKHAQK